MGGPGLYGYAINLSEARHKRGRTFKAKGDQTQQAFVARVAPLFNAASNPQEKRDIIVDQLKIELMADVQTMLGVIQQAEAWEDINALLISQQEKNALRSGISVRIQQGEREILNQPMDILKVG